MKIKKFQGSRNRALMEKIGRGGGGTHINHAYSGLKSIYVVYNAFTNFRKNQWKCLCLDAYLLFIVYIYNVYIYISNRIKHAVCKLLDVNQDKLDR